HAVRSRRGLPSFPTRRSSDLAVGLVAHWRGAIRSPRRANRSASDRVISSLWVEIRSRALLATTYSRMLGTTRASSPSMSILMRRSQQHTSELQSPDHLECRLL